MYDIDPHHALKGVEPNRNKLMDRIQRAGLGRYDGSHDRWSWNDSEVAALSNDDAYRIYRDIVEYKDGPDPHDLLLDLDVVPGAQIRWLHANSYLAKGLEIGHYAGHPVNKWRWHYNAVKKLTDAEARLIIEHLRYRVDEP